MSNTSIVSTKRLVGAGILVCTLAVVGTGRAIKSMLAPVVPTPVAVEEDTGEPPPTQVAMHQTFTPWQPQSAQKQRPAPDPDRETFKIAGISGAVSEEMQKAQLEGFRQDIAENADDDLDATLSAEDIAAMERDGVMAW